MKRSGLDQTLFLIYKALIVLFLVVEVYPIVWMALSSLKTSADFTTRPSYALPQVFFFRNYADAWTTGRMGIFFKNSAIATVVSLVFIVFLSSCVSFALAKMRWRFRRTVNLLFMSGIMVPVTIVLLPLFMMYKDMGLLNNRWALIITYTGFGLSLSTYLITGYLSYLPDELMEAAVIDGCSIYQLFSRIVVPLAINAIVTVLVIQFFFRWNDMIFSMTFISKTSLKTIQTGLMYFSDEYGSRNWGAIFAAITMAVTPTLGINAVLTKLVIDGMTAGAVKG